MSDPFVYDPEMNEGMRRLAFDRQLPTPKIPTKVKDGARLSEISLRYILCDDTVPEVEGYVLDSNTDDNSGLDFIITPDPEAKDNFVVPKVAGHVAVGAFAEYVGEVETTKSTFSYSISDEDGIEGTEFFLNGLNPDHQNIYLPNINRWFPETTRGTKLILKGSALFYASLMLGFAYSEIKDFNENPHKLMSGFVVGVAVLTLPMARRIYKEITRSKKREKAFWLSQIADDSSPSSTEASDPNT